VAVNFRAVLLLESDMAVVPDTYVVTRPMRLYDFHGYVTTQGNINSETVLQRQSLGTGAWTGAAGTLTYTNDPVGTLVRTASIVPAQQNWLPTDVVRINWEVGNTVYANHYVKVIPRLIAGD